MKFRYRGAALLLAAVLLLCSAAYPAAAAQENGIDDSDLTALIAMADSLAQEDYTAQSWEDLSSALFRARFALQSNQQQDLDEAGLVLSQYLTALVPMDYSALEEALQAVEERLDETDAADLLLQAVLDAREVYGCGDQAAVDQAAARLYECMDLPQTPDEDESGSGGLLIYILLGVSLVVNGVLAGVLIVWMIQRKRQVDDMPLVDYDIDDDMM